MSHRMRRNLRLGPWVVPVVAVALAVSLAGCATSTGGSSAVGTTAPASTVGAATLLPAGSGAPSPATGGPPIPVLGTENFYADLLAEVGGARVRATSLLNDPNTDPHTYEASPQAAVTVANARIVIVNGLGYDDFMQHLLAASPSSGRTVIDVQQLLGLPDTANAHVWYDPSAMPKVAQAAEAALEKLEPANASYFQARLRAYLASLQSVDAKIAQLKAMYSGQPVAFTEPVAEYLAQAIGLRVLTPEGFQKAIEDGTEPGLADVAVERDLLTEHKVRVLLYNSQTVTPLTKQMRELAVSSGVPVVGVSETMPAAYHTYAAWMLGELDALQRALAGGA